LQNEQDLSTRRNAFQFLTQHDQQRAINYLLSQVQSRYEPSVIPGSLQMWLTVLPCRLCRAYSIDRVVSG
jgi:hypothetical protein